MVKTVAGMNRLWIMVMMGLMLRAEKYGFISQKQASDLGLKLVIN